MMIIELYIWAMVITTMACVRPREAGDLAEWACASLAGASLAGDCLRPHSSRHAAGVRRG